MQELVTRAKKLSGIDLKQRETMLAASANVG
jgi:hypothetical protein